MRHLYALWVLVALLGAATIFALLGVQNVQRHQNDALHTIICSIVQFDAKSHKLTPAQKEQAARFWTRELSAAHLSSCDS